MGSLNARKICIPQGCLPLVLMFDIKEDVEVEPQCITALMEHLDVFISIKPKPKQPSKVRQTCTSTAQNARLTRTPPTGVSMYNWNRFALQCCVMKW